MDGDVIYEVKPGTKTHTTIRLKGKGVPTLQSKGTVRGDHMVTLIIKTPTNLNAEAKDLLRRFDELTGNSLNKGGSERAAHGGEKPKKRKGFMDKLKESLDDI